MGKGLSPYNPLKDLFVGDIILTCQVGIKAQAIMWLWSYILILICIYTCARNKEDKYMNIHVPFYRYKSFLLVSVSASSFFLF